jgi:hypothetical protein
VTNGAVLAVVALLLAVMIAGLFRLVAVLDSAEMTLRQLVAGVRGARRAVEGATELAAAVERDAAGGRLHELKQSRPNPSAESGTGPVSLPLRPGRAPR